VTITTLCIERTLAYCRLPRECRHRERAALVEHGPRLLGRRRYVNPRAREVASRNSGSAAAFTTNAVRVTLPASAAAAVRSLQPRSDVREERDVEHHDARRARARASRDRLANAIIALFSDQEGLSATIRRSACCSAGS
jgi:hypothetical protein